MKTSPGKKKCRSIFIGKEAYKTPVVFKNPRFPQTCTMATRHNSGKRKLGEGARYVDGIRRNAERTQERNQRNNEKIARQLNEERFRRRELEASLGPATAKMRLLLEQQRNEAAEKVAEVRLELEAAMQTRIAPLL